MQKIQPDKRFTIVALVLVGCSVLWYLDQVVRFGIDFDAIDLIGAYFIACGVALVQALRDKTERMTQSRFAFVVCTLSIPASALFFGQFLSAFDPRSGVNSIFPYLLRATLLGGAAATLFVLRPARYFLVPRWLLVLVGVVTAGWLFAHACPSIIREWYGTRGEPNEIFPKGMLILPSKNPERGVRNWMLFFAAVSWTGLIVAGRACFLRAARSRPSEGA